MIKLQKSFKDNNELLYLPHQVSSVAKNHESVQGSLNITCGPLAWAFCRAPYSRSVGGSFFDSFVCSWEPFPSSGLPLPALI